MTKLNFRIARTSTQTPVVTQAELFAHLKAGNVSFDNRDNICFFLLKTNNDQVIAVLENF